MNRQARSINLPREFLRECRRTMFEKKVADSSGMQMTGGSLLMRTLIFRRLLLRNVLAADERFVGLLIPPSGGGVLANTAVTLAGRVAVNLNYTVSSDILNYCIAQCGIRHVVTSRRFMERFPDFKLNAELVYLEDFREKVTLADKLVAAIDAYAVPRVFLERWLGIHKIKPDDLMTIIYTSGSTGKPKGVMLSFDNVGTNVTGIEDWLQLGAHDTLCGILPIFHSMGYTIGTWAVLATGVKGAYHFSPLDAKVIGKMCKDHGITIIVTTPTFLRSYLRRCTREEFAKLNLVVTGAEKLPTDLLEAFEAQFNVRPMEGYGTTELSPVVSVNCPPNRNGGSGSNERVGTVGRPIPGVQAKIVDHETGKDLPIGESGMLLIKGCNVMLGYFQMPEQTAKVLHDGWYTTGDMALLDPEGFIHITGRLSRFSKIGGEMVPHIHVEELLQRIMSDDDEKVAVAVTSVPDERKGERLIVFHLPSGKSIDQILKELTAKGLPNLWIPSPDSFFQVEQIPLLGTGKLDLQAVKELAKARVAEVSAGKQRTASG